MLGNVKNIEVTVQIPKFEFEKEINLVELLKDMGIQRAFNSKEADFSKMASSDAGNIYISDVRQKGFISVDENGTKASAITIIEVKDEAMIFETEVLLNRPFVFMIVDNDTNTPIFMGTVNNLEKK